MGNSLTARYRFSLLAGVKAFQMVEGGVDLKKKFYWKGVVSGFDFAIQRLDIVLIEQKNIFGVMHFLHT